MTLQNNAQDYDVSYRNTLAQITATQKENSELKQQLYTELAYTTIATKAASMGFVPEKNFIYLK